MPGRINVITPEGDPVSIPEEALQGALDAGYSIEGEAGQIERATREGRIEGLGVDTTLGKIRGALSEGLGAATLGLTQLAESTDPTHREAQRLFREEHPGLALGANIVGGFVPALASGGAGAAGALARATPTGALSALSTRLARVAPEAGIFAKVGRGVVGGAVEGGIQGVGAAASDLALADDPITMERVASHLSNAFLYSGAVGGSAGGAARILESTVSAAGRHLAKSKTATDALGEIPPDLATLDRRGLRARKDLELERIEAERVPQRAQVAADIDAFRQATKQDQPWVAVASGGKLAKKARRAAADAAAAAGEAPPMTVAAPRWVREIEAKYVKADKSLDSVLNNPKRVAQDPKFALDALQRQEHALDLMVQHQDELRALYATDRSGRRLAALDKVQGTLDANRAIQARITGLTSDPASPLLTSIQAADDMLANPAKKTLFGQVTSGAVFSGVSGLVHGAGALLGTPMLGAAAAPFVAAKAAEKVAELLSGKLGTVARAASERTTRAVDAFLDVTRKAQRGAPVLATKVLEAVRFGEDDGKPSPKGLTAAFQARSAELARAIMVDPASGKPAIRPEARAAIAERLRPMAAVAPHVADRLETHAVKRIEFLAARVPPMTRLGMTRLGQSEMAMRAFARYVAAVEDPGGIEERLADGTVTPEDAEVMRELYPERMADITRQIVEKLATLRKTMPYHRQVALSIFTGAPVNAACEPRILAVLQESHAREEGTEGGIAPPKPLPAFGSVEKSITPTPAQERAAGTRLG